MARSPPAKKGGEKVGLTKKGKGTKWLLVVDGNGLPLGFHLDRANTAEIRLAKQTLDTISVSRARGRHNRRPEKLVADRGYDSSAFRCVLRRRGIKMCIPPKRRPARWKAKRGLRLRLALSRLGFASLPRASYPICRNAR
jgi:transposase